MNMRKMITIGSLASVMALKGWSSVFFTVDVGSLQDENGDALVNKGMLYLISSSDDDTFSLPVEGAVIGAGSDDVIVSTWDLSVESSQGGEYIVSSGEVVFDGSWEAGNDLAILWFPNLTPANQTPGAGEPYGFYRNTSLNGGGDAWEMPINGTLLHSLKFFTDAQNPLVSSSDVPSFIAAAGFGAGEPAGPPVAPSTVATNEDSPGTVTFEWEGASVPGGAYRIERKLAGGSDWTVLGTVQAGATEYNDPSVGRGKDYEYRLVAINGFDSVLSNAAPIQSLRSSLANIATRGLLRSGAEGLFLGFTIKGTGPVEILARAQGPELAKAFGPNPPTTAIDPEISLNRTDFSTNPISSIPIGSNDNWGIDDNSMLSQLAEIKELFDPETFAQPNSDDNSLDAAMRLNLSGTNVYTAVVNDKGGANGLALVEVFDKSRQTLPNDAQNRLVNVATRGFVGTGADVLIAGFIVDGLVDSKLLLRGLGPSINGLTGTLDDPTITLYRTDFSKPGFPQIEVATNDNWDDSPNDVDEIIAVSNEVGAAELVPGAKDSILLVDAVPGLYSFILSGVNDGTGIGLVEVFLAD